MKNVFKPVTPSIRFASIPLADSSEIASAIDNASASLMDNGSVAEGEVSSSVNTTMATQHLWWIIPVRYSRGLV